MFVLAQDVVERIGINSSEKCGKVGTNETITAYVDDFTLNGVPVQLENGFTVIPEPSSAAAIIGLLPH